MGKAGWSEGSWYGINHSIPSSLPGGFGHQKNVGVWRSEGKLGGEGEATNDDHSPSNTGKTRKKVYSRSLRTTLDPEDKELQPQCVLG